MSEKLSALIDNELDELERARLLKNMNRDSELAELWSRYHVIGLAMRREEISWSPGLTERINLALEKEGDAGRDGNAPGFRVRLPESLGRFAVAASVAAVALVGALAVTLYQDNTGDIDAPSSRQLAFSNDATRWEDVDPQVEDALNALLVEHGEFASASGMNGLNAYTKFVAYDSR
jgi:sigma-E factor negative regulatory protein RseA